MEKALHLEHFFLDLFRYARGVAGRAWHVAHTR